MLALFGPFGSFKPLILSLALLFVVIQLIALIDILRSRFKSSNDKLIWVLVVLLLNTVGALRYFFIGRSQRIS